MSRVSASASIGVKLKFFSDYENVNPHASVTIEREYPDTLSDPELAQKGSELYDEARKVVQKKINSDIASAKGKKKEL